MIDEKIKAEIDALSRVDMARLHRFAPSGHPYFAGEAGEYFQKRFQSLGGMSPSISRFIGWAP